MIFPPFCPALAVDARALLPLDMEAAMAAQNPAAQRLALMGFRGPYAVRSASEAVIVCSDGKPMGQVFALSDIGASDRMWLAEQLVAGLNDRCGYPKPAIGDRFDPHHLAAVSAESRHFAERTASGELPEAAE